jgi:hypothetical protein
MTLCGTPAGLPGRRPRCLRPDAAVGKITKCEQADRGLAQDNVDRSLKTKAVTGYRTPN